MNVLYGITCSIAILFMSVGIFIGIWLFIVALKAFRQLKYKNYILEKIFEKLDAISINTSKSNNRSDTASDSSLDPLNLEEENNISEFENLKNIK